MNRRHDLRLSLGRLVTEPECGHDQHDTGDDGECGRRRCPTPPTGAGSEDRLAGDTNAYPRLERRGRLRRQQRLELSLERRVVHAIFARES